jgi:hypothetical protein
MNYSIRPSHVARSLATMALALLGVTASRAAAQTTVGPTYSFGVSAGLTVPVGDLSNYTSSGYTVGVTLGMHQPLVPLGFRVEGSFTEFPWSNNSDVKHRIYGIGADLLYNLGTPSTNGGLYLTGGGGMFGSKDTGGGIFTDTNTNWDFGINGGLGYYLPLSGFTVVFEGRYRNIFSSGSSQGMFPITVGVTF